MDNSLSKYILSTITYYDVMDYPLTAFDVWKQLTVVNSQQFTADGQQKFNLLDVIKELEDVNLKKFVDGYRGYYFLKGRKDLVETRISRNKNYQRKIKIVRRAAKWLRIIPFVKMVAVTGSLAMKNPEPKSDLDLLIVMKAGHIFTGRLLATLLIHILGMRRYDKKIKDRICLNYFLADNALEISLKDVFAASEYSFVLPVYGLKTFRQFRQANRWIAKYKPNYAAAAVAGAQMVGDNFWLKLIRNTGEKILGFPQLEEYLKKIQLEKIAKNPKTRLPGGIILADDGQLVFLPIPQSPQIFEKFKARLDNLKA